MVPLRQLSLRLHRGRFLRLQLPDGHPHVTSAYDRRSCPEKPSNQARNLPSTPYSTVARAGPQTESKSSRVSSLMASSWGVQRDSWEGSQYAYAFIEGDRRERQDLLWKTFFQDHTRWLDNRHQKRNSGSPDFRHKDSGEALWLDNSYKPAWVDSQLATLDAQIDQSATAVSPWNLSSNHGNQLMGSGSVKRWTLESVKKLCQQGQVKGAVEALEVLVGMNVGLDKHSFYSVLKECVVKKDLMLGGQVHALAVKMGLGSDTFLCNHFIRMYAGHGKLEEALDVFRGVALPDAFMWSSIISAHAKHGKAKQAIDLYRHMRGLMIKPNGFVFVAALQACAAAGDLQSGKELHDDVLSSGMEKNIFVCNCLVDTYAKCGSLKDARRVFDGLAEKDVVTWNAMIAGYARVEGMGQEALSMYRAMCNESITPDVVTFVCLLQACANVGVSALENGKQLHSHLQHRSLDKDVVVGGSLVNMYVKCGSLRDARIVFNELGEKNVVTWVAMIAGYAQQESMGQEALRLYDNMHSTGIVPPNAVTFACLLQACANVGGPALETGKKLHAQLKYQRFESDGVVGCSLVSMYAKCGNLKDARIIFDGLSQKSVATWTTMIACYAQQEGMVQEALNLYSAMCNEGMTRPDAVTYACLLEACASASALQQGKQLHSEIRDGNLESNVLIGNCLVKMYAKCGCLEVAREVFDRLPVRNLVTWTTLLKGYAENGEGLMAIRCFEELWKHGIQPDEVTYACLFAACSRAGLVDQGQQYFETMVKRHGVEPNDQHYNCMVDLLGRSGHLDRAEQMLRASGLAGNAVSWRALLSACKSYGDAETARRCFDHLVELEPTVASAYVLLSSIYANAGIWDEVDRVESMRKAAGARKMAAKACIEVKDEVHEFTVGEERSDVAATLRKMNTRVREGGHVPQTQLVLRALSEQEKVDALCGHAEKLALAYGLLHTPAGSTLVVTKNLRMCNDCHSSTKIMSRLEKRGIVVRDSFKVHRFQHGACSCQDRP